MDTPSPGIPDPPAQAHDPQRTIFLRRATADDLNAIEELERLSFSNAGERFTAHKIKYLLNSSRACLFVAERAGHIAGWAAGIYSSAGPTPWGRIFALAVHPMARKLKIGARLSERLIDEFRQRGARRVFLEVRADNASALRLYTNLGFTPCRDLADYYGPGIDARRMQRVI